MINDRYNNYYKNLVYLNNRPLLFKNNQYQYNKVLNKQTEYLRVLDLMRVLNKELQALLNF